MRNVSKSDEPKSKTKMSRLFQRPYGWIKPLLFFVVWYVIFEFGLTLFKVDIVAMLWVPLHFVITPILGIIVSIVSVYIALKRKKVVPIATSICCALMIFLISFIGVSGSTIIIEFLDVLKFPIFLIRHAAEILPRALNKSIKTNG